MKRITKIIIIKGKEMKIHKLNTYERIQNRNKNTRKKTTFENQSETCEKPQSAQNTNM